MEIVYCHILPLIEKHTGAKQIILCEPWGVDTVDYCANEREENKMEKVYEKHFGMGYIKREEVLPLTSTDFIEMDLISLANYIYLNARKLPKLKNKL